MSIATEISRLQTVISNIKTSLVNKGVAVPQNTKLGDIPSLIASIEVGGGGGDGGAVLLSSNTLTATGGFIINDFETQDFDDDGVFELNLACKCSTTNTQVTLNINSDYAGASPNSARTIISGLTNSVVSGIGGKYISFGNTTTTDETYKVLIYKNLNGKICVTGITNTVEYFSPTDFTYNQLISIRVACGDGTGIMSQFSGNVTYSLYKLK